MEPKNLENKDVEQHPSDVPKPDVDASAPVVESEKYVIGQVPSSYDQIITNKEGTEGYDVLQALAKVMNDIENIKETLGLKK